MDISIIINDIVLPIIWTIGGLSLFTLLISNLVKCMRIESENTLRLSMKIEDVPNDFGDVFKDIFSSAFARLIERRNNDDI